MVDLNHFCNKAYSVLEPECYGDLVYTFRKIYACIILALSLVKSVFDIYTCIKIWAKHKYNMMDCMHVSKYNQGL